MTDLDLKAMSCFSLLNLSLGESFRFAFCGRHHCQLTIFGVMIVETIGVHHKVYVDTAGFVHNKGTFSVAAIVSNIKFATNILEGYNIGYDVGVKPNVTP